VWREKFALKVTIIYYLPSKIKNSIMSIGTKEVIPLYTLQNEMVVFVGVVITNTTLESARAYIMT